LAIESERTEIAKLNLIAGQKAKAATAYAAATEYLQVSLGLLAEDSWIHQYELTLALHDRSSRGSFFER
jgi:predicted ATPase